jgi:ribokinase
LASQMSDFDAVGFGALNVDRLYMVDKIAETEDESFVTEYKESCGGSAANTMVGLARLGLKVGFVGKVADDYEGRLLLDDFRKENVDTHGIAAAKNGLSGVVMGFIDEEGQRALYVVPGVNDAINLKGLSLDYLSRTRLLHLSSFVGEKSFESQKMVVDRIPSSVKVSFDPGMLYAKRGLRALRPIIRRTFVIMPNEAELKLLTGAEYEEGAEKLGSEGVEIVAVKLGKKGCFVTNREEKHLLKPCKAEAVDTTGAGDAWNAGFLYGLLKNRNLRECGRLGNLVASRCIGQIGARTGLPHLAELQFRKT